MITKKINISDDEWFNITFDENREPLLVVNSRVVWSHGSGASKTMNRRVDDAVKSALRLWDDLP